MSEDDVRPDEEDIVLDALTSDEDEPLEDSIDDEEPTLADPAPAKPKRERRRSKKSGTSLRHRLYHGETTFDFIGRTRQWFLLSAIVILIGLGGLVFRGFNLGLDFEGGTAWTVITDASVERVRDVVGSEGIPQAKVQQFKPINDDAYIRVTAKIEGTAADVEREAIEIRDKLADEFKATVDYTTVGASWGSQITEKAIRALVVFFLVIFLYLFWRFEWRAAVAAMAAVVHDIFITVGVYALSGFEITPSTVVAFLTILGFSLYDTVVVFDRVDENAKALASTGRYTYSDVVNLSMNQVLMRSLNTSITAILPIFSILIVGAYILGATTLRDFGLAMFVGMVTGVYSSIYIASPVLALLKEREPRYKAMRQRIAARRGGAAVAPLSPAAAARSGLVVPTGRGRAASRGEEKAPPVTIRDDELDIDEDEFIVAASTPSGKGKSRTTKGKARPNVAPPRPAQPAIQPRPRKKGKRR